MAVRSGSGNPEITASLATLAILRQAADVTDVALDLYSAELTAAGVTGDVVAAACHAIQAAPRADGETAFPSLGTLLTACASVRRTQREDAERASRQRALGAGYEPRYTCGQCLDDPFGWVVLRCPDEPCGRERTHAAHDFGVRCPHWLREHADAIRVSAQQALQRGQRPTDAAYALQDLDAGTYRYAHALTARARWARAYEAEQATRGAA